MKLLTLLVTLVSLVFSQAAWSGPSKKSPIRQPASDEASDPESASESAVNWRGWSGLDKVLLISGSTSIGSSEIKAGGSSSSPTTIKSNDASWSIDYLHRVSEGFYIGPGLGYNINSQTSSADGDSVRSSLNLYSAALAVRSVTPTGKDQYFAFTGSGGITFLSAEEGSTVSGATETANLSGSGFGYSGGIIFGQRLGRERSYLLEVGVNYGGNSIDYTLSGDASGTGTLKNSGLTFGLAIGVGL